MSYFCSSLIVFQLSACADQGRELLEKKQVGMDKGKEEVKIWHTFLDILYG